MYFISWNVNGIRAAIKKGFHTFIQRESPDVFCAQETRASESQVDFALPGYQFYLNECRTKKGYSGVAVWTKKKPLSVSTGMNLEAHDGEGRVLTLEYEAFFLVNVYTPNSQRGLTRLDYRSQEWDKLFLKYLKNLEKKKPVVFCGDLNVAHKEIDLANPNTNRRNAGFTDEERAGFDALLAAGFIDTFREFCDEGGHYTWWSNFNKARERNIGWRIDYFCISPQLRPKLKSATILPQVMGSDHCPVTMTLEECAGN